MQDPLSDLERQLALQEQRMLNHQIFPVSVFRTLETQAVWLGLAFCGVPWGLLLWLAFVMGVGGAAPIIDGIFGNGAVNVLACAVIVSILISTVVRFARFKRYRFPFSLLNPFASSDARQKRIAELALILRP